MTYSSMHCNKCEENCLYQQDDKCTIINQNPDTCLVEKNRLFRNTCDNNACKYSIFMYGEFMCLMKYGKCPYTNYPFKTHAEAFKDLLEEINDTSKQEEEYVPVLDETWKPFIDQLSNVLNS